MIIVFQTFLYTRIYFSFCVSFRDRYAHCYYDSLTPWFKYSVLTTSNAADEERTLDCGRWFTWSSTATSTQKTEQTHAWSAQRTCRRPLFLTKRMFLFFYRLDFLYYVNFIYVYSLDQHKLYLFATIFGLFVCFVCFTINLSTVLILTKYRISYYIS